MHSIEKKMIKRSLTINLENGIYMYLMHVCIIFTKVYVHKYYMCRFLIRKFRHSIVFSSNNMSIFNLKAQTRGKYSI